MTEVAIVGIGIHPFGRTEGVSGQEQGIFAVRDALHDAGIDWSDLQFAYGGSAAAGTADSMVSKMGLTGLQFINVANGCATGGSALQSAYMAIKSGAFDVGVAVGFDKHERGAFRVDSPDWYGQSGLALTTQFFGMKIQKYMADFGITDDTLIKVAEKSFQNGSLSPTAWRKKPLSYQEIKDSPVLSHPLRKYQFCSPAEGGAAIILCRADIAEKYTKKPLYLKAAVMRTRRYGSFEVFTQGQAVEQAESPTVDASKAAFEMAGLGPEDIDVAQLQDTEVGAEIMHMSENGFCKDGDQEELIQTGATQINGAFPVNTDGGCIANGEPIGASGLRQVHEICTQLRGDGGKRQASRDVKTGYTHVYGAPGLSAVTIIQR
jgi:acetyl-CoA acetyltransferase